MSASAPLLQTIEPDDLSVPQTTAPTGQIGSANNAPKAPPVILTPTNHAAMAPTPADAEAGEQSSGGPVATTILISGLLFLCQSAHPLVLLFLYLFRIGAVAVYILCSLFTDNYVVSTVIVVVLLAMDFWNCRNVAGRTLVGLRYWNQVDDDGESYWVFESRDPSRPANPVDARMFWIALYSFPALWTLLFIISVLRFNISFLPIVALALVFNITNAVGFTYADRDAKQRWANSAAWNFGIGGIGGQLLGSAVKSSVGRVFGTG